MERHTDRHMLRRNFLNGKQISLYKEETNTNISDLLGLYCLFFFFSTVAAYMANKVVYTQ